MSHRRTRSALVALAMATSAAAALHADWIVTRNDARIRTNGPWRVQEDRVIFELGNGQLASLHLAEVDLEASAALTELSKLPRPRKRRRRPPKKKAVLVITDADVEHADPKGQEESGSQPVAKSRKELAGQLEVVTWSDETAPSGILIRGRIRNAGHRMLGRIRLSVSLVAGAGEVLGASEAVLQRTILRAQEESEFQAEFPGLFSFSEVEFDAATIAIAIQRTTQTAPDPPPPPTTPHPPDPPSSDPG